MNFINLTISTKRLEIIPISIKYAQDIYDGYTAEIAQYMSPAPPKKIDNTLEFITSSIKRMEKGEELEMVILDKFKKDFLGLCGIHKIKSGTPEPGIWIKKDSHMNGFGKEAILALKN